MRQQDYKTNLLVSWFFSCFVTIRKPVSHSVMSVTKAFVTGLFRATLAAILPGRKKAGSLRKNMELLATKSPTFFRKYGTYI
ncbi:MAG: hypothetical protein LBL81_00370 [Tannerella sp.]|jgi:hypothetical protein|nr:hypothetical protein [Tannerella sp.]